VLRRPDARIVDMPGRVTVRKTARSTRSIAARRLIMNRTNRRIRPGQSGQVHARVSDLLERRRPIHQVGDDGEGSCRKRQALGRDDSVASSWSQNELAAQSEMKNRFIFLLFL